MIADAGFNYTEKLNVINDANIKITGSSLVRRSLIEVGSEIFISRNGVQEFHGLVNSVDFLDGGGISVLAQGFEVWLAKENGDYPGSPWSSTASATIFSAVLGESNHLNAGTIDTGLSIDFRAEVTDSLWNVINNLRIKTSQDIGIDYANSEIDILDHKGSQTSVATFNAGIQIKDLRVGQAYPLGNDVRVYGSSEGATRIKSNTSEGQDATSKATYGIIRKIIRDPSISTVAEADILANALVAIYKDPVRIYDFDVINPNQSIVVGDVIILNAPSQGLSNEEVRIVKVERGMRAGTEYLTLEVTNKEYSILLKNRNEVIAGIERNARDNQTYDQYQSEYSNQTLSTNIAGFDATAGFWMDIGSSNFITTGVGNFGVLNVNISSINNVINAELSMNTHKITDVVDPTSNQDVATKKYVDDTAGGGGAFTVDHINDWAKMTDANYSLVPNATGSGVEFNDLGKNSANEKWADCYLSGFLYADSGIQVNGNDVIVEIASSTDNAIPRWNGTGGGALQNSGCTINDSNVLSCSGLQVNGSGGFTAYIAGTLGVTGNWTLSGAAQSTLNMNSQDIDNVEDLEVNDLFDHNQGFIFCADDFELDDVEQIRADTNNLVITGGSDPVTIGGASIFGNNSDLWVVSDLDVNGTKNCVVNAKDGRTYIFAAIESPELWFEEKMSSQLVSGEKEIILDPRFIASTVIDALHPINAIATPTNQCNGLWVEKKFDRVIVHELNNGTSDSTFDITLSAKRLGYEDLRFDEYLKDTDINGQYKKSNEELIMEKKPLIIKTMEIKKHYPSLKQKIKKEKNPNLKRKLRQEFKEERKKVSVLREEMVKLNEKHKNKKWKG